MSKESEVKIIPPKAVKRAARRATKQPSFIRWSITLVIIYFMLMLLVSFLPLVGYMKVLSLILGTFIVFDLLHSVKWYIKNINEQQTYVKK